MEKQLYKALLTSLLILTAISLVSAAPGIPNWFYGDVIVNGQPAPDNNVIEAEIGGDVYITVTTNGQYGLSPSFYVEDPDYDRLGEVITFYVGGMNAGNAVFQTNGYNELFFDLITTCGDNYCLGDETCSSCQNDCGICTNPPFITISSPEQAKVYDTTKINLVASADQEILIWMYSLDSGTPITFSPDITLTLEEGSHTLDIIGISISKSKVLQSGSRTVSFSIDLPDAYCGDLTCNNAETCTTCPGDCGTCSTGGSSGGGRGGSSGGGGGGGSSIPVTTTTGTTTAGGIPEDSGEPETQNQELIDPETKSGFSKITGAVVGSLGETKTKVVGVFLIVILGAAISIKMMRKKKEDEI